MNVVVNLILQVLFLSQTLKMFCWVVLGMLLGVNVEKWWSWCGLEVVVISEGGEG